MKLLCRVGWHNWEFVGVAGLGWGSLEQCRRCNKRQVMSFASGFTYYVVQSAAEKDA